MASSKRVFYILSHPHACFNLRFFRRYTLKTGAISARIRKKHCEDAMDILYQDRDILVCIKPPRVLSTDEPGGLPDLVREALGDPMADIRTVHRLDRVVSGLMVLARNAHAASELSRQIRENVFKKEYLAVIHGIPKNDGTLRDLLGRDKARRMTFVAKEPAKGVQEAVLHYHCLHSKDALSRVRIRLETGRTHQIRVQFASRGMPLVGERKYDTREDPCEIALWSCSIGFIHPGTGEAMSFYREPPAGYPWDMV
jgi:23S rRNA pseudouridine1911/1915/1917 synthase